MERYIAGRVMKIDEGLDGLVDVEQLRRLAGAWANQRALTVERADGSVALVPARGRIPLAPSDAVIGRINGTRGR